VTATWNRGEGEEMLETHQNEKNQTELEKTKSTPAVRTPFTFLRRFTEDMERMFEDFRIPSVFGNELFGRETKAAEWMPQIELVQNNGQLTVRCDLPGMKKDDIKVELKDEVLTISGERNEEKKDEGDGYYRTERSYGSFYRQVPLPVGAKSDTAEATFRDGVLEIKMLATEKELPGRKLEIKDTGADKATAKAAA
jgi:HSP20 family protein